MIGRRTIAEQIRGHIVATRPRAKTGVDIDERTSLVATGVLDSLGVFTLVAFLEQQFGIEVADEELRWKNFESIDAITRLVESKRDIR